MLSSSDTKKHNQDSIKEVTLKNEKSNRSNNQRNTLQNYFQEKPISNDQRSNPLNKRQKPLFYDDKESSSSDQSNIIVATKSNKKITDFFNFRNPDAKIKNPILAKIEEEPDMHSKHYWQEKNKELQEIIKKKES